MLKLLKTKDNSFNLDLKDGEHSIVAIESSNYPKQIQILINEGEAFSSLCCHLHEESQAFAVPYFSNTFSGIPENAYFVLTQDNQSYTVFFCLSHQNINSSLKGSSGGMLLNLSSGNQSNKIASHPVLVCFKDKDMYHAISQTMKMALQLTGGMGKLLSEKLPPPAWLDGLGWESGIAMGSNVSHEKIITSVQSLVKAGYPPTFVIIDEGWQHLEKMPKIRNPVLASFEADKERFPEGIRGVVNHLRQLGVKHVGVWHGMMGYRAGIHEKMAKEYDLPSCSDGRYYPGADLGKTFKFFYDYYGYLREQGIDFIKVGDQSALSSYCLPNKDATTLCKNLQAALQAAASIQFNSAHFNTECLHNENLFYWGNSRLARSADDIDASGSVGMMKAISHNLANSLWLQHLMQPDFDAWLTNTEQSETMAIFHALSGTINVIGDVAGTHNKDLISKFLLPCGHLLKADRVLTLCADSVFCNPLEQKKIYKAFTYKGEHGVIGAFNLMEGKRTLHGFVSPKDVPLLKGELFALFSHHNGFVKLVTKDEAVAITLKPYQSDVLTFSPVHHGIAVLGGCSFFLAPGPILDVNLDDDSLHITSCVATRLLVYCDRQILEVRRNGKTVPWEYDSKRHTLSIDFRSQIAAGHMLYSILFET